MCACINLIVAAVLLPLLNPEDLLLKKIKIGNGELELDLCLHKQLLFFFLKWVIHKCQKRGLVHV